MDKLKMTNHALYRQWDRGIDGELLLKVYPHIQGEKNKKRAILVLPSFFRKQGISGMDSQCLILIVRGKYLVTGYWRSVSDCFFGNKILSNPQILN